MEKRNLGSSIVNKIITPIKYSMVVNSDHIFNYLPLFYKESYMLQVLHLNNLLANINVWMRYENSN